MAILEAPERHQDLIAELIAEVAEVTLEDLAAEFGDDVAQLVDGVTKLTRVQFQSREQAEAENYRKMILAMARDPGVILIKLADRLHNLRTIEYLGKQKQVEKAREEHVSEASFVLQRELEKVDIPAEISGRAKHFYSIYDKMAKKGKEFNEIYDLTAMRVIAERTGDEGTRDCYGALGLIHSLWKPMPGRFKDYIAMPKLNRYRSLHTTVIGPEGRPLEIQIRTREMHETAELGIAAHWAYKRGGRKEPDEEWVAWMRQLLDTQQDESDPGEYMKRFRTDLFADEVYAFTPKGQVKMLPAGPTPIDFAYSVHTDVRHRPLR